MKKIIIALAILIGMAGCVDQPSAAPAAKSVQAQKAQAAADSITFTENAEIDNIKRRLELTANPGLLGYVVLLNEMGQPIMYTGVKGKITSGSKRLTKPYTVVSGWDLGEWSGQKDLPAPSDEGTYGGSGDYVFFWTISDQYIQWNGKFLYSDKPFRLSVEPIVIGSAP